MQNTGELILYKDPAGDIHIDVSLAEETVWLSQQQMARLFGKPEKTIAGYISKIFEEGELARSEQPWIYADQAESVARHVTRRNAPREILEFPPGTLVHGGSFLRPATVRTFTQTVEENGFRVPKSVEYFSLEVVVSVGYRVKSLRGTQFRRWATQHLREYLIKGFSLNDRRLQEARMSEHYFQETLEKVQSIRNSDQDYYQKVLELFAMSADYDPQTRYAWKFFAIVQNKFKYAIEALSASSLIPEYSESPQGNPEYANWTGEVNTPLHADLAISYLKDQELKRLHLLAEQFLSYAALQGCEHRLVNMQDWLRKLDEFLRFHRKDIEVMAGQVTAQNRESHIRIQLARYAANQSSQ